MSSVSIYELKSHLSKMVGQVEAGGEVVITKRGKPVAKIVRVKERGAEVPADRARAMADLKSFAVKVGLRFSDKELRAAIDEGRE